MAVRISGHTVSPLFHSACAASMRAMAASMADGKGLMPQGVRRGSGTPQCEPGPISIKLAVYVVGSSEGQSVESVCGGGGSRLAPLHVTLPNPVHHVLPDIAGACRSRDCRSIDKKTNKDRTSSPLSPFPVQVRSQNKKMQPPLLLPSRRCSHPFSCLPEDAATLALGRSQTAGGARLRKYRMAGPPKSSGLGTVVPPQWRPCL